MVAADKGHLECVRKLLDAGAKTTLTATLNGSPGARAIHFAQDKGHGGVNELLMAAEDALAEQGAPRG